MPVECATRNLVIECAPEIPRSRIQRIRYVLHDEVEEQFISQISSCEEAVDELCDVRMVGLLTVSSIVSSLAFQLLQDLQLAVAVPLVLENLNAVAFEACLSDREIFTPALLHSTNG